MNPPTEPVFQQRLLPPVKVAPLDLDAFLLRRRAVPATAQPQGDNGMESPAPQPGTISPLDAMPTVTRQSPPFVEAELMSVAQWLHGQVHWAQDAVDQMAGLRVAQQR